MTQKSPTRTNVIVPLSKQDVLLLNKLKTLNGDSSRPAVIRAAIRSYAATHGLAVPDEEKPTLDTSEASTVYLGRPINA